MISDPDQTHPYPQPGGQMGDHRLGKHIPFVTDDLWGGGGLINWRDLINDHSPVGRGDN